MNAFELRMANLESKVAKLQKLVQAQCDRLQEVELWIRSHGANTEEQNLYHCGVHAKINNELSQMQVDIRALAKVLRNADCGFE